MRPRKLAAPFQPCVHSSCVPFCRLPNTMLHAPLTSFVIALCLAGPLATGQSDNPQEPRKPEMPEIQAFWAPWQDGLKAVAADRDQKLKNLDYIYMLNLDKQQKDRSG